jgi:hypothetical protein
MKHICYFFDESGNSGSRFWDAQQPTYVEAGWALERSRINAASSAFRRVEDSYPVKSKKVKGKDLLKHTRGQEFIVRALQEIGQCGGIPTAHIVEKKYWVCGKVVETFLDPAYNSKVPFSEIWDLEKRQAIAQVIYDTNSPLLEDFADAYRARDPNAIKASAEEWSRLLEKSGHKDLSDIIKHIVPTIEDSIVPEFSVSEKPEYRGIDSMNLPVWFDIFQQIEQNTPADSCSIIHHQMDTFESAYVSAFRRLKNAAEGTIAFRDRQWVYPLTRIQNLFFESSDENPLVRCADFIASGVAHYINSVISGEDIPIPLHKIGFLTLGIYLLDVIAYKYPQLGPPLNLGSFVGSDGWVKKVLDAVRNSAKHMD